MAKKDAQISGETPATSMRLPPDVIEDLDALVQEFSAETGLKQNRTMVIIQLIRKEKVRRRKKKDD